MNISVNMNTNTKTNMNTDPDTNTNSNSSPNMNTNKALNMKIFEDNFLYCISDIGLFDIALVQYRKRLKYLICSYMFAHLHRYCTQKYKQAETAYLPANPKN
jgi:hypothetical protein